MSMAVGGGKGNAIADINVTPMVDIMLVLLIIFMVVTPLLQKGVSVDLAKTNITSTIGVTLMSAITLPLRSFPTDIAIIFCSLSVSGNNRLIPTRNCPFPRQRLQSYC